MAFFTDAKATLSDLFSLQPDLLTSDELVATYKGVALMTSKGPVTVKSLANSPIK